MRLFKRCAVCIYIIVVFITVPSCVWLDQLQKEYEVQHIVAQADRINAAIALVKADSNQSYYQGIVEILRSFPDLKDLVMVNETTIYYELTDGFKGAVLILPTSEPQQSSCQIISSSHQRGFEVQEILCKKGLEEYAQLCPVWRSKKAFVALTSTQFLDEFLILPHIRKIVTILREAGYEVVQKIGTDFVPEDIDNFGEYGVIILSGHAGNNFFSTSLKWTKETISRYLDRYRKGHLVHLSLLGQYETTSEPKVGGYIGIHSLSIKALDILRSRPLVYLNGCSTMEKPNDPDSWAQAFGWAGADVIIGNKTFVLGPYAVSAAAQFFDYFINKKNTIADAISKTNSSFGNFLVFSPDHRGNVVHNAWPKAVARATPQEGPAPLTVTFSAEETYDPDHDVKIYEWFFGNGAQKQEGITVTYTFPVPGEQVVTLRVIDSCNHSDEVIIKIIVTEPINKTPVAVVQAIPVVGPAPLTVSFDASRSYDPDGRIISYHWDFGDGETVTTSAPYVQHTYVRQGIFTTTLRVTDDRGASAATQVLITVTSPACPDLTPTELWIEPLRFFAGQRVRVWAKIKNVGNTGSSSFRISMTVDGREFDSGLLNGLQQDQTVTVYSDALVWPDGNCHTLAIVVDRNNDVPECNEMNNQLALLLCPSTQCINRPSIWTNKSEYCLGEEVLIYINISVPSFVDVWVVYQNGSLKYLLQNHYLEDPSKQYVLKATAGEPLGPRKLYLKSRACGGEVTVLCEITVKDCISPPQLPDLIVKSIDLAAYTCYETGYHIEFNVCIQNIGAGNTAPTNVVLYALGCLQTQGGHADLAPLGPGEKRTILVPLYISWSCLDFEGGEVDIQVIVDRSNVVKESNENNNTFVKRFYFSCL